MKLFATSDLHLTISSEKDMSRFGPIWENHIEKLRLSWNRVVSSNDIVIIAGDISWANNINEATNDFNFLESLSGKKLLTIGNHDRFHQSSSKTHQWLFERYSTIVPLLRDDWMPLNDISLCSTVGCMNELHPEFKEEFRGMYKRECERLERTLCHIPTYIDYIILICHYPPIQLDLKEGTNTFFEIMKKYKVKKCLYGHLHGDDIFKSFEGIKDGIEFKMVSGEKHNFEPQVIYEI